MRQPSTSTPSPMRELEELDPLPGQGLDLAPEAGVGRERPDRLAFRQADELGRGRRVERPVRVEGPLGRRRDVVAMDPGLCRRADPFGTPPAVQPDAVEEPLGRVLGRGGDVEPAALLVDGLESDDVVRARRQELGRAALSPDGVGVVPAVALAQPEQPPPALEPDEAVHGLHPGFVGVGEDRPDLAGEGVAHENAQRVLQAIEVLEDDLAGVPRPFEAGDVGVRRIAGRLQPDGRPARDRNDPGLDRRIRLAGLGVLEALRRRVEGAGVVDQGEGRHARRVEPPEGDARAVGAPAEAVADAELLLVDPVGGPVDDLGAPVVGQPGDPARGQVLGVDVVPDDVGRHPPVGRELGEHQGRRLEIRAEPAEPSRGKGVGPEVAARVLTPDPLRVGEDDQHLAVGRPGVILDRERFGGACGDEFFRADEDLAPAGRGPVQDEVAGALGRGARLERRIGSAVAHPPGRAEALGGELAAGEDAFDGQDGIEGFGRGRRLLCRCGAPSGQGESQNDRRVNDPSYAHGLVSPYRAVRV